MASSYARKLRKAAEKAARRKRRAVYVGEVPDGFRPYPHPEGGIIIAHPDHPPVWIKPDGTREEIKP